MPVRGVDLEFSTCGAISVAGMVAHACVIPDLRTLRKENCNYFKANWVFIMNSRTVSIVD